MSENEFNEWGILELMGHFRTGGLVTEEQRFGATVGRIDIPTGNGGHITQYFGATALFRFTPTSEEIARAVAVQSDPHPIGRWELLQLGIGTGECTE